MTNYDNSTQVLNSQISLLKNANDLNSITLPGLSGTSESSHTGIESVNKSLIRVYIGNGSTVVSIFC